MFVIESESKEVLGLLQYLFQVSILNVLIKTTQFDA